MEKQLQVTRVTLSGAWHVCIASRGRLREKASFLQTPRIKVCLPSTQSRLYLRVSELWLRFSISHLNVLVFLEAFDPLSVHLFDPLWAWPSVLRRSFTSALLDI